MTTLRPVAAMDTRGLVAGSAGAAPPEIRWVYPTDLMVNADYQRELGERGVSLIRKIVSNWDWRRFKPPICAETEMGLEVIDGQHSAIAAASHPDVQKIPVVVVTADRVEDRAGAFIGHNRDRIGMTATQLHYAAVAAGDEDALTVNQVCADCNVKILKSPPSGGVFKPRDTMAVAAIRGLVSRHGRMRAREVVEVCANAELAPVGADYLKAVELVLTHPDYAGRVDPGDLTTLIREDQFNLLALEREAALFAAGQRVARYQALAAIWFRKVKKRGSR